MVGCEGLELRTGALEVLCPEQAQLTPVPFIDSGRMDTESPYLHASQPRNELLSLDLPKGCRRVSYRTLQVEAPADMAHVRKSDETSPTGAVYFKFERRPGY